ncbi:MAG: universal stress protein [Betaproteobacteria bacterium]|nr:universal stress protein [Betaproteobacteria bacterium]
MRPFARILVATDFSACADKAAERAVDLSDRYGADLIFLHVVTYFPEDEPVKTIAPENVDPAEFLRERGRVQLRMLADRLGRSGAEQRVIISAGSARHEIVRAARERQADLIVMGMSGKGLAGVLGSTACGLMHLMACSVLAVPPNA